MLVRTAALTFALALVAPLAGCEKESKSSSSEPATKTAGAGETKAAKTNSASPTATMGSSLADAGGSYAIDPAHTQALFKIQHLGASYQYGRFNRVEGSFTIDPKNLSNSEISIEIPTASVFTGVKKRDDHLRSPDFFDAKQFPTVTFKSTDVKATGANTYAVTGDLTMHGVTKPITIELQHVGSGNDPESMGGAFRTGFNGESRIKRSNWNMNYMQGGLGDEVTLLFAVEGTRK